MIEKDKMIKWTSTLGKETFHLYMYFYAKIGKLDKPELQFDLLHIENDCIAPSRSVVSNITKEVAIEIRDRLNEFIKECEEE